MPEVRIALDEQDFRRLVSGRVVETEVKFRTDRLWVQIGLKDIGFPAIIGAVNDVMQGSEREPRPAASLLDFPGEEGAPAARRPEFKSPAFACGIMLTKGAAEDTLLNRVIDLYNSRDDRDREATQEENRRPKGRLRAEVAEAEVFYDKRDVRARPRRVLASGRQRSPQYGWIQAV